MGVSHCAFFLSALIFLVTADESLFPHFAEPMRNVTVEVGRDVRLTCLVDNLGGFKVAWMHIDKRMVLAINNRTFVSRVISSSADDQSWSLHIHRAQESDQGWYRCQVNTKPAMLSQKAYLQVVDPWKIDEKISVRQFDNVTLECELPGYSIPYIKWKREDQGKFEHNGDNVNSVDGRTLSLSRMSPRHAGTYLCINVNASPSVIVKRIALAVQSSHVQSIPKQLKDAILEQNPSINKLELRTDVSIADDWIKRTTEKTSDVATTIFPDIQPTKNKVRKPRSSNFVSQSPPSAIDEYTNESLFPQFAEPIPNVTVSVGRDALLACVVDNLKGFKVAWVRVDTQTILSIHHNIISQNPRISLSYNDHRSWYLHIKSVQESDRGWYMCQVNTDPMRSRQGYLQVVVPPVIIDEKTSTDLVVRESSNITLVCKASGYPEPYVMWRREDGEDFSYNGENVNVVDGEILSITKVSRLHMGAYLCIASNGVPPSISKRVMLMVQFPPMLSIPNQLEAAYAGQDVALECHTEAYPASINYWTTERGDMILSGDKYEAVSMDSGYTRYMMLKIRRVGPRDFGSYKCVAKNSLGETDGVIRLDEIPAPSTTTSAAPMFPDNIIPMRKKEKHRKKKQKFPLNKMVDDYDNHDWKDSEYDFSFASARPPPSALSETTPLRVTSPLLTFCILYNLHTVASSHFHVFHRIEATLR